jgi:hypothetical protein
MEEMFEIISRMDPKEAMAEIAKVLKALFPVVDEEARAGFLLELIGESEGDKVSSLVHL